LVRAGQQGAFDTLAARYRTRLFWFCWQMLKSREDVEDALQDVFTAAFNAIRADDREIQVRPWLYRIARNRCINQLRHAKRVGVDVIDDDHAEHEHALIDQVIGRQRFRELIGDVQALPDSQRTALLLCEVDGLSYQRIALAMDNTVPGVKSLLVRARANLLNSAAAREMTHGANERGVTGARRRAPARGGLRPIAYQRARAAAMSVA